MGGWLYCASARYWANAGVWIFRSIVRKPPDMAHMLSSELLSSLLSTLMPFLDCCMTLMLKVFIAVSVQMQAGFASPAERMQTYSALTLLQC